MTFHFQNLPFSRPVAFSGTRFGREIVRRRRSRLIARWQRGADGQLECRWLRQPINFLSD